VDGPYRDGKIYVCSEMCSTCIFRPGNVMSLKSGRLKQMVADACRDESCIPCHHTIPAFAGDGKHQTVCRGFWDRFKTAPLQIGERLGMIVFQAPPEPPL
jgi:hypothetical protein